MDDVADTPEQRRASVARSARATWYTTSYRHGCGPSCRPRFGEWALFQPPPIRRPTPRMNLFGAVGEELWEIEPPANVAPAPANAAPTSAHAAAPSNTATSNAAPSNDVMDVGLLNVSSAPANSGKLSRRTRRPRRRTSRLRRLTRRPRRHTLPRHPTPPLQTPHLRTM